MGKLYSKIASLLIVACILSIGNLQAQAPLGFNYQGVALTNAGTPVASKVISLRIALIESQQLGTVRYQEVHNVNTDAYGQFSVIIGNGQVSTGKMTDVQWSKFPYYMKVELDLTGGMRLEHFEQDRMQGDTYYYLNADSTSKLPVYPIFRLGAHYEVAKFSHLRASFGQGVRFPSVAERYTKTSVGALNVFPNAALTPETGWAAEIGFKQGVKIGENWKGLIDVAGFINQYSNMMEFTFGFFDPSTNQRLNPEKLIIYQLSLRLKLLFPLLIH